MAVSAVIWLFPLIVLAVFVLKYNYHDGGTPSILYVSVALLQLEFNNNPQLKSYLRQEWSWLSMVLAVMLFLDLIAMYAIKSHFLLLR
ncbi:MAG: hypothetical protein ACYC27_06390 [Armatimonadota bacterium]